MKKSLISLAVIAASGASFAQSSVSVYGIADVVFASVKQDTGAGTSVSQTKIDSGAVSTSRYGFKGSEDLGAGLKANFKLEQAINIDTGAAGTPGSAFSRYAYVGFSGESFGEIKLGLTGTAYDEINANADPVFDSNVFGPQNIVFVSNNENWHPANTFYYATPSASGFSGAFSYSLGENKNATVTGDASSITSFHFKYEAGPLYAGFAYQSESLQLVAKPNDLSTDYTRLNATYDLGVAKLLAAYGHVINIGSLKDAEATEWSIGADYPVTSTLILSGGYARSNHNDIMASGAAGLSSATNKVISFGGSYSLSKRTSIYAGYESHTYTKASTDISGSTVGTGVKHTF